MITGFQREKQPGLYYVACPLQQKHLSNLDKTALLVTSSASPIILEAGIAKTKELAYFIVGEKY